MYIHNITMSYTLLQNYNFCFSIGFLFFLEDIFSEYGQISYSKKLLFWIFARIPDVRYSIPDNFTIRCIPIICKYIKA